MDNIEKNAVIFSGHQPNFLPYMGFFYKIFKSDVFVFDDDVQYSREGLHNANFIKVNNNKHRITIPVSYRYGDLINQVRICYEKDWKSKLLKTVQINYRKTPYFDDVFDLLERHISDKHDLLFELNYSIMSEIIERFELNTKIIIASREVPTKEKNNKRNVFQCKALGGTIYYSGVGGKAYNDEEYYRKNGIAIIYSDYKPLKYRQNGKEFIENLSVLDYIFNCGYNIPDEWLL